MPSVSTSLTWRVAIAAGGGLLAAPVLKQPVCELRLPAHVGGLHVSRDCNQVELAVAGDLGLFQPRAEQVTSRLKGLLLDPVPAGPGIHMEMQGFPDDPKRTDLIADLRKLSDEPIPLP